METCRTWTDILFCERYSRFKFHIVLQDIPQHERLAAPLAVRFTAENQLQFLLVCMLCDSKFVLKETFAAKGWFEQAGKKS